MKHWYNNSKIEIQIQDNCEIPDGFSKGRLPFSNQCKDKMSKIRKGKYYGNHHKQSEQTKKQISETLKTRWEKFDHPSKGKHPWNYGLKGVQIAWNKGMTYDQCIHTSKQEMVKHIIETKRKNKSFNKSNSEQKFFELLKCVYNEPDIIRQYSDERYPFNCDFYIKSLDLFIQCNFHWTHGGKPFDSNDQDCIQQLKNWQEKAIKSKYHSIAIQTWTIRDVKKLNIAKQNNLKYLLLYTNDILLEEVQRLSKECFERNTQITFQQSRN